MKLLSWNKVTYSSWHDYNKMSNIQSLFILVLCFKTPFNTWYYSVIELPKSTLALLKDPVYIFINIGSVCGFAVVTGFLTFAPKYLETQFYVKKSNASLIVGVFSHSINPIRGSV